MILVRHAVRLVTREPRRSFATLAGVAIASALLTSILLFGAASGSTVTRRALADLPVDAQVVLGPNADGAAAVGIVQRDPAVTAVTPYDLAHFNSAATEKAGTATQTSDGVLLGIDPDYTRVTDLFAISSGSLAPGGIVVSRDLASNLGVVPGDRISFTLAGGAAVSLPVTGVVSIVGADLLLGPIDSAHRSAGANPPANVAVMSRADLASLILSKIPPDAVASDPATTGAGSAGSAPVFAAEPAVRRELHVRLDHAQLPGQPAAAQAWLDAVRRRIEREGSGTLTWVDDASASLEPIAADLAWGQILFIFLALPGVVLALALARLAADATADTTRRHAALLRARGATRRDLWTVFVGATALIALAGAATGMVIGAALAFALFAPGLMAAGPFETLLGDGAVAVVLTTIIATLAAIAPLRDQIGEEIAAGRQELQRVRAPLWQRWRFDLIALVAGGLVFVLAGGTGVHPILNAEGDPTVTLALTAFAAPLLLWVGGTLLLLRVAGGLLRRSGSMSWLLSMILGPGGFLAGRSLAARAPAASRAVVNLALAIGFATSVLLFDATYRQQQRIDAQLTLGADLKATPASGTPASAVSRLAGDGVGASTPFVDRVVYVGPEAQDLLAVDPSTLASVAPLADSFFADITAGGAMDALRARPDAVFVSAETAKDYSIVPGDTLRVRIPDASGSLRTVQFVMAGIALEFPTAPRDAFLVANLAYVVAQTGDDRISFALARANGDVGLASTALARRLGADWQVASLDTTTARLANGITSVDLSALVVLDVGFAVLIAATGVGLFLLAGLAERRRELATMVAVGADPAQLRASIVGEGLIVGVAGTVIGLATGGVVGMALLQILAGVFDPPANAPAVPSTLLAAMLLAIAVAIATALAVANRGIGRLRVAEALRER